MVLVGNAARNKGSRRMYGLGRGDGKTHRGAVTRARQGRRKARGPAAEPTTHDGRRAGAMPPVVPITGGATWTSYAPIRPAGTYSPAVTPPPNLSSQNAAGDHPYAARSGPRRQTGPSRPPSIVESDFHEGDVSAAPP